MKKYILLLLLLVISSSLYANDKLNIFVSILPQKFLVEQIAGNMANVNVLVSAGQSPHSYEPLPKQMAEISRADVFFTIGVPFEKQFVKRLEAICPNLKIIPIDAEIEKRIMSESDVHKHEEEGHDEHGGEKDPHIWLDPILLIKQAENIAKAIIDIKPEKENVIRDNLSSFSKRANELTAKLQEEIKNISGETILVFHPAFGYLADRLNLVQRSVEIEGKEPGPKQLASLIRMCNKNNIHIIFVQKQFPVAAAKTIAQSINGTVVAIDPLAENIFENLQDIAELLKKIRK